MSLLFLVILYSVCMNSDFEYVHTIMFKLGTVFQSRKILFFSKIVTFILHGPLQLCCLVNVLKTYTRCITTSFRVLLDFSLTVKAVPHEYVIRLVNLGIGKN